MRLKAVDCKAGWDTTEENTCRRTPSILCPIYGKDAGTYYITGEPPVW